MEENNTKFCKFCGEKIDKDSIVCSKCGRQLELVKNVEEKQETSTKENAKFYEQPWFMWLMLIIFAPVGILLMWKFNTKMKKSTKIILSIVFGIVFLIALTGSEEPSVDNTGSNNNIVNNEVVKEDTTKKVEVIDFSAMKEHEILTWCNDNNLNCNFKREYSDTVTKGGYIKQSVNAKEQVKENTKITVTYSLGKEPTIEQKNALKQAESYSKLFHMSKDDLYDQLVSEYGGQFSAKDAKYAVDNIEVDWNENALAQAKNYRETMSMSKNAIYDQLISEYGGKFTKKQAQYAIDHLDD